MSKPFTVPMPSEPNFAAWSVFKTVIVLPYEDLVNARIESLRAAYKTIYMKKGPHAALTLYDLNANYVNVGRALKYLPNTDSLHMLTHGNYQYGTGMFSPKQEISFFKLHKGSYAGFNHVSVFWRLGRNTPDNPDDDGIPSEDIDENGLSAWDWNLYCDPKIKISVLDFCFSVRNDRVPSSLGVFSNDNYQNHDQVAVGWIDGARTNWDDYSGLIKQFWVLLRTNSVYHAALECVLHPEGGAEAAQNFKMSLPGDDDYAKLINFN